jgi:hypothetical protein
LTTLKIAVLAPMPIRGQDEGDQIARASREPADSDLQIGNH